MEELEAVLGTVAAVNWGGFWRRRWQSRVHRELVVTTLDRLRMRLDAERAGSPEKPVRKRGGWMKWNYQELLRLNKLDDLPLK